MNLGRNYIANLFGFITPLLVALITTPLYLSYIGPERFGVLAVIMTLAGYMGIIDLGLGRAVTQRMASTKNASSKEHSELLWTAVTASFAMGASGGIGLWLGATYLLKHVIEIPPSQVEEATYSVTWLGIAIAFILPASALIGALQAKFRFVEVNIIQALGGSAGLAIPLMVASQGYIELTYLVPVTLSVRALTTVLLFMQCKKHVPLIGKPGIKISIIIPLLNYGGWISVMSILRSLLVSIDRVVLASISGARSVTSYTIPYELATRLMIISGSFSGALFPQLAASNNGGKVIASRASETLVAMMTPAVITCIFLAEPFLTLWINPNFAANSRGISETILIGVWINAVVIPHYTQFLATNSPKLIACIYIIEIPIYFYLLWQCVSNFGMVGAALAWSIRVFIDAGLILRLNNVFTKSMIHAFPSFLLIIAAYLSIHIISSETNLKILICDALLILSVIKDRRLLLNAYQHIMQKTAVKP